MGTDETSGFTPPMDEVKITSLETVKVLSDPLRLRIVEELMAEPRTVKQLAQSLEMKPTKLYYHINLLEEHGLIRVVSTRVVSGIIEKHYHITAYNYPIDKSLLSVAEFGADEGLPTVISSVLEHTSQEIRRAFRSGLIKVRDVGPEDRTFMMLRSLARLKPEQAKDFIDRLQHLIEEFTSASNELAEGEEYRVFGLTMALYPTHLKVVPKLTRDQNEEKQNNG